MDIRQPLLLLIAIAVPVLLYRFKRQDWIVGWVAITLSVHVFDTSILTNLPAARIVGLLYLPLALLRLPAWLRFRPVAAWTLNFAYLLLLGFIFGFILPWPDFSGTRAWSTTASGRAFIYPLRLMADLGLMIFLAEQFRKPGMILFLGRMIVAGATLTAAVGALNLLLPGSDFYYFVTGLGDLGHIGLERARGFSFEPRGLGLACVYGIMILLIYPGSLNRRRQGMIIINILGLLATFSTSALSVLVIGLITVWNFLAYRVRWVVAGGAIVLPILVLLVAVTAPAQFQHGLGFIQDRTSAVGLQGAIPSNLFEAIAWRLDVFDASSLLFLGTHPLYVFTGTGPGEIMLAASESLPPGIFTIIFGQSGLNGMPTLGLLLEICNSGLIGAGLWCVQVFYCVRAFKRLDLELTVENSDEWQFGRVLFFIGVALFLVQAPLEQPYWPVILSIGWAACSKVSEYRAQARLAVMAAQPQAL